MLYSQTWLEHFARHARAARDKSKDTTKIGCLIIGQRKETILTAYNDHAIGIKDSDDRRSRQDGMKYKYAAHAERNAIAFAAAQGIRLEGLTLYSTAFPCCDCANSIVQAGIKCVIVGSTEYVSGTAEVLEHSRQILTEGGVQIIEHDDGGITMERADALARSVLLHLPDSAGDPLYYHVRRVADSLGYKAPSYYRISALLHDIIEDSAYTITIETLKALNFPERVIETVDIVTIPKDVKHDDAVYETDYIERIIKSGNLGALVVKMADNFDNLSPVRLAKLPEESQLYFKNRYTNVRKRLGEALYSGEFDKYHEFYDYWPSQVEALRY